MVLAPREVPAPVGESAVAVAPAVAWLLAALVVEDTAVATLAVAWLLAALVVEDTAVAALAVAWLLAAWAAEALEHCTALVHREKHFEAWLLAALVAAGTAVVVLAAVCLVPCPAAGQLQDCLPLLFSLFSFPLSGVSSLLLAVSFPLFSWPCHPNPRTQTPRSLVSPGAR